MHSDSKRKHDQPTHASISFFLRSLLLLLIMMFSTDFASRCAVLKSSGVVGVAISRTRCWITSTTPIWNNEHFTVCARFFFFFSHHISLSVLFYSLLFPLCSDSEPLRITLIAVCVCVCVRLILYSLSMHFIYYEI